MHPRMLRSATHGNSKRAGLFGCCRRLEAVSWYASGDDLDRRPVEAVQVDEGVGGPWVEGDDPLGGARGRTDSQVAPTDPPPHRRVADLAVDEWSAGHSGGDRSGRQRARPEAHDHVGPARSVDDPGRSPRVGSVVSSDLNRQRVRDPRIGDRHHADLMTNSSVVFGQLDCERLGASAVVPGDEVEDAGHRPEL